MKERTRDYTNRELSWMEFNERVLQEACNRDNPLFERMKFLSIVSTNLDEFFMIRVASLRDVVHSGAKASDPAGIRPEKQLEALLARIRAQVEEQYTVLKEQLLPELANAGIRILRRDELTREQTAYVQLYFEREVAPILTPMAVDSSHHFPLILSKSLNIAVLLAGKEGKKPLFATVQVPAILPRVLPLPATDGTRPFVLMEDVVALCISLLFTGRDVLACSPYRITRNADLTYDEEEAADLLREIQKSLKKRKWGAVIRLEYPPDMDATILRTLKKAFDVEDAELFPVDGPINLDFLMKRLYSLENCDHLKYVPFKEATDPRFDDADIFSVIRRGDLFFYHPYDSFNPVVRFVREAADDPDVLAIKQTLYRVSGHSPIVAALAKAAENGKQVTVLLEVKARFDEENNIHWGKELKKAGCHVVYGLPLLKTHSKITLVVRRENGHVVRYTHLATGNYNDVTARLYTDMGILTADPLFGEDAGGFFNKITGYCEIPAYHRLVAAPDMLRGRLIQLICREAEHARSGRPALIEAKMNSLVDPEIIDELYRAGELGVRIDLTVRGICCLQPQVKGLSENITVRSIVGRFLEHARIFRFENGGDAELYLSSADWMPRNLDRRIELMFPVLDAQVRAKVEHVLRAQQEDTAKAWRLEGTTWTPLRISAQPPLRCTQEEFIPRGKK